MPYRLEIKVTDKDTGAHEVFTPEQLAEVAVSTRKEAGVRITSPTGPGWLQYPNGSKSDISIGQAVEVFITKAMVRLKDKAADGY